jgi:hypothetical protein
LDFDENYKEKGRSHETELRINGLQLYDIVKRDSFVSLSNIGSVDER